MASRFQIRNEMTSAAARASRDLKSFKDGDEVRIKAGDMKDLRAKFWRESDVFPGHAVVWVHSWRCHQTIDQDHLIHARR